MRTLDVTCGIYDTEYKLTAHKDGSLTIKAPTLLWANNNGNLAFRTVKSERRSCREDFMVL